MQVLHVILQPDFISYIQVMENEILLYWIECIPL